MRVVVGSGRGVALDSTAGSNTRLPVRGQGETYAKEGLRFVERGAVLSFQLVETASVPTGVGKIRIPVWVVSLRGF